MKYILEITSTYEVEATDLRDAQKKGYVKAMEIFNKDSECLKTQVSSLKNGVWNHEQYN